MKGVCRAVGMKKRKKRKKDDACERERDLLAASTGGAHFIVRSLMSKMSLELAGMLGMDLLP